jgi:uncharacterized membrane protein
MSISIESVSDLMVFLEPGVEPSGARIVRKLLLELRAERSLDLATTCVVTKSSTRKLRLSSLCSTIPTILPARSWDSEGKGGWHW